VDEIERVSLTTNLPGKEPTDEIIYLHGNQWGIEVDVVRFAADVPWIGNKIYYRIRSTIGFKDGEYDRRPIASVTEKIWAEIVQAKKSLVEVGTIDTSTYFRDPEVGGDFAIALDRDGHVSIERKVKDTVDNTADTQP
jgi:hypothetical protein